MLQFYLSAIDSPEEKRKFEQLYLLYYEHMLRVAQKILQNKQQAEDATHQAFLRIMSDMTKIGEVSSHQTRSYVVIIVRGIALNMLRAQRKVVDMPYEELVRDVKADSYIEDEIFDGISREELRAGMMKLPLVYRDVLYLMYLEDMCIRDIAKRLGKAPSKNAWNGQGTH